ncbi:hypothetical protein D3C71_1883690 [compost metagenome]
MFCAFDIQSELERLAILDLEMKTTAQHVDVRSRREPPIGSAPVPAAKAVQFLHDVLEAFLDEKPYLAEVTVIHCKSPV